MCHHMRHLRTKRHHGLLMLALAATITACSTIDVSSDYDPKANFARYQTYGWLPRKDQDATDPRLQSSLLHSRIREAVTTELTNKGLRHEPMANPDLLVAYHVALEGKLDVSTVPNYPYWPSIWGATTTTSVRQYEEGSLILDLVDVSNHHLVWRGSAKAEVKPDASPEQKEKRIKEAVHEILKNYPPH